MNKTLKNILLYFAIIWAIVVALLWIIAIWWNIDEEIIWRTILTYIVLFLWIVSISWAPKLYEKVVHYPDFASIGIWLLTISISIVGLLICISIWDVNHAIIDIDFIWKVVATIGIINFAAIVFIFSMDKWGPKS